MAGELDKKENVHVPDSDEQSAISPIVAEIIRHGFLSIANQVDINITRTAFSPLIYEYKDYAVGIVDAEGRLICQSTGGIPLFVANAFGIAVRDGLAIHGRDGIRNGDVLITNHAATMGQHLNNVVMYAPIFVGNGGRQLFGFMCVLTHWIDVGGGVVGSFMSPTSTEIFQEGIQFRSVKLWSEGKRQEDIYRIIEVNTRFPHMTLGDLGSQLAGCLLGRDKVVELVDKYNITAVTHAIKVMWNHSERIVREAIRAIPDGKYEASSFLDNDGIDLDRRIRIGIAVEVSGDEILVDYSGIDDQLKGPLNAGREGGAVVCAMVALKYIAAPHEPANDGSFRPLKVVIPEGKFLSATGNAPLGLYSATLATVIDTILKAMVPALPDLLAGGHHGTMGLHSYSGREPGTGELFHNLETSHGGWGASLRRDGPGPFKTISHGDTRDVPTEVQESLYPLRIEHVRFRCDSGGPGRFRGGLGVDKLATALAPCEVQISVERTMCPPWGVEGGQAGQAPVTIIRRLGEPDKIVLKASISLLPGDQVHTLSGGGGGFGSPFDRAIEAVAIDVQRGLVSREAAYDQYGVLFDVKGQIDHEATRSYRRQLKLAKRVSSEI